MDERTKQIVTAAEATRNFSRVQEMVARSPVFVTHHGRDRMAILSTEEFERLTTGARTAEDSVDRRKLLLILDSIKEGYISLDPEWRYVTVNRVAELFLGQPREDLIGQTLATAFPSIKGTVAEAQLRRVMYQGEEVAFDWDSVLYPGRRLHMRAFPLPSTSGGIGVLFTNLGERERLEATERLHKASLHHLMAELPGWAMFSYDASGLIREWPESAKKLLGWEEDEILHTSVERVFKADCLAAGRPWSEMAAARRDGRTEADDTLIHKDGTQVHCHSVTVAPPDCPGQFIRIVSRRHGNRQEIET